MVIALADLDDQAALKVSDRQDENFVRLLEQRGPPPQIVWVTLGNVRNAALRAAVLAVWPQVAAFLVKGEPLVEIG